MRIYYSGSTLLVSLILLAGISLTLFFSREKLLANERFTQALQKHYLSEQLKLNELLKLDKQQTCREQRKDTVVYRLKELTYAFHCDFSSLFLYKPTKEKYIQVDRFEQWLNLADYAGSIHYINALDELPSSTEHSPKIVRVMQPINARLTQDFYGIIMTDYPFYFTDRKIYGVLYSTHPENNITRRNLSFKRSVIQNLEQQFSYWSFLPHSQSLLFNE